MTENLEVTRLLLEQKETGEDIERLLINYKKDPAARKTAARYAQISTELDSLWMRFERNHLAVLAIDTEHNREYFTRNYFEVVSSFRDQILAKLQLDMSNLNKSESNDQGKSNESEMIDTWTSERTLYSGMLRTNLDKFNTFDEKENDTDELEFMLRRIERYYNLFTRFHFLCKNSTATPTTSTDESTLDNEYDELTDKFQTLSVRIESVISQLSSKNLNNPTDLSTLLERCLNNSKNEIRLPRIEVPKFNGDMNNWQEFRELFSTMIHENKKISDVQKIQYLKTHVIDSAAEVIKHFQVNANNYLTAWTLLNKRYNNKKLLINNNLKRLFSQRYIKEEKSAEIKSLLDTTKEIIYSLENYGESVKTWNCIIVFIVNQRLPNETLSLWEQNCGNATEIPQFEDLENFLENRFRTLETIERKQNYRPFHKNTPIKAHATTTGKNGDKEKQCPICKNNCYSIFKCKTFKAMDALKRLQCVDALKLCHVCLKTHSTHDCKSSWTCYICKGKHNATLHVEKTTAATAKCNSNGSVLLATAEIYVIAHNGNAFKYRALIDQGSMASFVSEKVVQQLDCARSQNSTLISGIGGCTQKSNGSTKLSFHSIHNNNLIFHTNALILPKLTSWLPAASNEIRTQYSHYTLADPHFHMAGKIDVILGANVFKDIILSEVHKNALLAQNTHLGWILSGAIHGNYSAKNTCMIVTSDADTRLCDALQKFWETEEKCVPINSWSAEETACEEHYCKNTYKNADGRYICKLPFKNQKKLGKSKHTAIAYMIQLEKKFRKNHDFKNKYVNCMREYFTLGHAIPAPSLDDDVDHYYIPHLAVVKETSLTTKTRIVFNASSKSSNGLSLNDTLMIGPVIQPDAVDKITRFRMHKYVFVCDVEKMYRQIKMHSDDWKYQRFVWRENESEALRDYCLTTVTFGQASAPFTAIRTLKQIAIDNELKYPIAAKILINECYVDDIHYGADSIEQVVQGRDELITALKSAGLELRKWATNESSVLASLPPEMLDLSPEHRFMGIMWDATDSFSYPVIDLTSNDTITKRELLTLISKVYDPMGWMQPIIITAKLLMQETWKTDCGWDEQLPDHLMMKWRNCRDNLSHINSIKIPRWIGFSQKIRKFELHGFADASQVAYGSVIFSRIIYDDDIIVVRQITAKSRVAPMKMLSIPRLELKGALLMADLMEKVKLSLDMDNTPIFAWIDSKVALHWIKAPPTKWKPFVRNRVNAIQEMISPDNWNYVPTAENPADLVSRGCDVHALTSSDLWFKGPSWLSSTVNLKTPEDQIIYGKFKEETDSEIKKEELKTVVTLNAVVFEERMDLEAIINKYSSFEYLCIIMSWLIRFSNKCRKMSVETSPFITLAERITACNIILKYIQSCAFNTEIIHLAANQSYKNSKISNLNPFVHPHDGLLRVGGRLSNASIPFNQRHPIILPSRGNCITAIIRDAHLRTLHGGKQATLSFLRQKFWILSVTRSVKTVIQKCMRCQRNAVKLQQQMMAPLPEPRVTLTKPFLHTGLDFAGPFQIKSKEGRGIRSFKAYIAIFVCLATKAIHIELVGSLTSDAAIAAIKRFVAKRGVVKMMYSDNGTNFVGAFRKLKRIMELVRDQNLEWKFIPPSAPHFGGLWEAGVKSIKFHLKRVLSNISFTWEEMTTILAQIENVLNSRPLCPLTNDIDDINPLTPNHFLFGQQFVPIVEENYISTPENLLKRWQLCTQKYQEVCKRYKTEYLHRLIHRPKWLKTFENVRIGQLFLIKDDNRDVSQWPLGRITEIHPGSDGLVRVVTLKTKSGSMKRPIHKLSPLPIDDDSHSENSSAPIVRRSQRLARLSSNNVILSIIICLGILFATVDAQSVHIFKHQPGVYFKNEGLVQFTADFCTMSVKHDISNLISGSHTINASISTLEKICAQSTFNCSTRIDSLRWQSKTITESLNFIQLPNRKRRVPPLVLAGLALITGTFGTVYYYHSQISGLRTDITELKTYQDQLLENLQTHTALMDISATLSSKLNNQTQLLKNGANENFKSIENTTWQLDVKQQINDIILSAQSIMSKIERVQTIIYALKTNQVPSVSFTSSLGLYFLDEYLRNISELLPPHQMLPQYDFAEELLTNPSCATTRTTLEFKFQIPIVYRKEYAIMKLIPVPSIQANEMLWIEPSCENIAVSANDSRMIHSLNECKRIQSRLICPDYRPISDTDQLRCELGLLYNSSIHAECIVHTTNTADTWIHISNSEWLFVLPEERELLLNGSKIRIKGSGIISRAPTTSPRHINESFIISDKFHIFIPSVNLSQWTNRTKLHHIHFGNHISKNLVQLNDTIKLLHHMEDSTGRNWRTIASTTGPYALSMCLASTFIIYRIYQNRHLSKEKPVNHSKFFTDIS